MPYEDWVERRRESLARLHRRVLTALATAEAASDPDAAEERLHALLATEPTNETAARWLNAAAGRARPARGGTAGLSSGSAKRCARSLTSRQVRRPRHFIRPSGFSSKMRAR